MLRELLSCNVRVCRLVDLKLHSYCLLTVVQFQLRYSPALANKPKSNKSPASKPIDPFENPAKGLFITDVSSDHYLVLNKFPVIPDHFILATKTFKKQTNLLEENDLGAAYDCLDAYREHGEELFGFFNSGDHSGARCVEHSEDSVESRLLLPGVQHHCIFKTSTRCGLS